MYGVGSKRASKSVAGGTRTRACMRTKDLKSFPLTTRAPRRQAASQSAAFARVQVLQSRAACDGVVREHVHGILRAKVPEEWRCAPRRQAAPPSVAFARVQVL